MSGDVEDGVEGEISDALAQGGRLEEAGRPDGLIGAQGAETQQLLVPVTLEALLYRGEGVEGKGG